MLRVVDLEAACKREGAKRPKLEALMTDSLAQLDVMSKSISHVFFAHASISRQLLTPGEEGLA
jgi:hypothetical protein